MVKFFVEELEEVQKNPRLATRSPDINADFTEADYDIFPLMIALSNRDLPMFKYFWENHALWDETHLYSVFEILFCKAEWNEVLTYILKSGTTRDIFHAMSFEDREKYIEEMFRRYI